MAREGGRNKEDIQGGQGVKEKYNNIDLYIHGLYINFSICA